MSAQTKILIVEHDLSDLELLQYELKTAGINYISEVVQTEKDYCNALKNFMPDIILSDYTLPRFDGPTAFKMREELAPDTPFIFVSGNIGEENSIEYIKNGVTDYALKDKLFTLSTKIKRALKESKEEQQKNKTEQERRQSERRLARAQQIAHMGSWELNLADNIILWSDEMCSIYGLSPDQNQQSFETWLSFTHPDDLDFVLNKVNESREQLQNFSFFYRIILKNGSTRHIYTESKFEFDQQGNPGCLYAIAHDVTEIKQAEAQIEFERNNLKALINNTNDLMWSVDKDFKLIISNQPFDEVAGLTQNKKPARESDVLLARFSQEQLMRFKKFYKRSFAGETFTEIEYADQPVEFWSEISFSPIRKGKEVIGAACYSREITARKLSELERTKITNELIQRNQDLEQFTYIVSHNLRAPVANIIGAAGSLNYPGLSIAEKELLNQGLTESVAKLDDVVKDLNHILQVKSEINETKKMVHFSALVEDIKLSIKNLIDENNIEINYDFSAIDEYVTLKSYLYSVFYNLIYNSVKYRRQQVSSLIEIKSSLAKGMIELVLLIMEWALISKKERDKFLDYIKDSIQILREKAWGCLW